MGLGMTGKQHSEETKQKISASLQAYQARVRRARDLLAVLEEAGQAPEKGRAGA